MGAPAAALVYLAITIAIFRELVPNISTHIYAYLGDPLLNASIMAWNARVVPLSDAWWNFPSFAPLQGTTSFTEHLLLAYPLASPIFWLTGNAILAYNVVFLLAYPLNGLAAYALARELTGSRLAALVGGLAYAFAPYQAVQMTHVQTLMGFGIPLTLLGLHRHLAGRRGGLAIFALGWTASVLQTAYMLVFVPILVAFWGVWFIRPREWRRVVAPFAIAVVVMAALVPLLLGYQRRHDQYGIQRSYDEVTFYSADVTDLSRIFHRSTLWRGVLPETHEEGAIFPGFAIIALAAIALLSLPVKTGGYRLRLPAEAGSFYAVAALLMWLLTLGPEIHWNGTSIAYGPYRLLMELPGVSSIRVPPRAWLIAALCLAMLAAFGVKALAAWIPRHGRALVLVLGAVIVAEGWFYEVIVEAPRMVIERGIPAGATVLDVPIDESFWNAIPQYRAVIGGYRTISGYSGFEPPHFRPYRVAIADLNQEALDSFRRTADLYAIIRPGQTPRVVDWIIGQQGAERLFVVNGTLLYRLPRLEIPR